MLFCLGVATIFAGLLTLAKCVLFTGPFWCAQDDLTIALTPCMKDPNKISVNKLVYITYTTAMTRTIDFPSNLKDDRVFLLSGALDTVVVPGVVKKLLEYYSNFVDAKNIAQNFTIPAEHSMVCVRV